MQRLDVPHLRVRTETCTGTEEVAREKKNETREDKEKKGSESIEEVDTSDRAGTSSRVKKDRADRKKEAKTQMWSDVVKGLEIEGKLETTNSDGDSRFGRAIPFGGAESTKGQAGEKAA